VAFLNTRIRLRSWLGLASGFLAGFALMPAAVGAAFPPGEDGKIAFYRFPASPGPADIWTMSAGGSGKVNLTDGAPNGQGDPAFSPNGRQIAYGRATGGQTDIWTMNANGSRKRNLTKTPGFDESEPEYSPDGRTIAFLRPSFDVYFDVWTMSADGSGKRRILSDTLGSTDFSPNGRRIAYSQGFDIWSANLNGSGKTNLTNTRSGPDAPQERDPAFSPNGNRITYDRDGEIGIMNADGSGQRSLIDAPFLDGRPVFSPDGRRIAFEREDFGGTGVQSDIWVMSAGGSGLRNLTRTEGRDEMEPDWQSIQRCGGRRVTITGDDGPDTIKGTGGADVIMGFGGNDKINGRGGKDVVCGGGGSDRLRGGGGRDRLIGGAGKDSTKQ
jgi:TolB protein